MVVTNYQAYREIEIKLHVMIMRYAADPEYILGLAYDELLTTLTEHEEIAFVGHTTDWRRWMTRVTHALDVMRREHREAPRQDGIDWFRTYQSYVRDFEIPPEERTRELRGTPVRMNELLERFYSTFIPISFR